VGEGEGRDKQFDKVLLETAPEMVDRVAAAMAQKYWLDLLIKYEEHPCTARLIAHRRPLRHQRRSVEIKRIADGDSYLSIHEGTVVVRLAWREIVASEQSNRAAVENLVIASERQTQQRRSRTVYDEIRRLFRDRCR